MRRTNLPIFPPKTIFTSTQKVHCLFCIDALSCPPDNAHMKSSVLHIVLSFSLLLAYSGSRLLPCSGAWDMDKGIATTTLVCDSSENANHEDSHGSHEHDHSDHQCVCPCHAPALSFLPTPEPLVQIYNCEYTPITAALLNSVLSPPDHIPIS